MRSAVRLGWDAKLLAAVRDNQSKQRQNAPLFDTQQFTRDFERGVTDMFDVCLSNSEDNPQFLARRCAKPMHIYGRKRASIALSRLLSRRTDVSDPDE